MEKNLAVKVYWNGDKTRIRLTRKLNGTELMDIREDLLDLLDAEARKAYEGKGD